MIAKVESVVWDINPKFLTVGVGGIGFKVFTTTETKEVAQKGADISLFTHLAVREDALDLYGFLSEEELNFFEMLISISGIGPKTALNVHLTKVSGIGKKVAEKIVLELKDKVSADTSDISLRDEVDAIEALKSLGYSQKDAREALKEVEKKFTKTGDRVREALKILGK
jgi:Holliday junction DNA helicase RuvA